MKAIIEMPKGDDRRRHIDPDKLKFVDLGLIRSVIPINNGIMPIHYGYIPETLNEKEGDEIDVLVLSDSTMEVGQEVEVEPIALLKREDGDDKVIAVDRTKSIKKWNDVAESERILIEKFFGYHHKLQSVQNGEIAKKYIESARKQFLMQRNK